MPPISSSRLAPRTVCSSPNASIWASQVRKSCLGALRSAAVASSAGRFMTMPFRSRGALERAVSHRADEVAPIIGACIVVLRPVGCRRGGISGSAEGRRAQLATVERRLGLRNPPRPAFGAADSNAGVGHGAVLEPIAREHHGEREVAGAAAELAEAETRVRRQ